MVKESNIINTMSCIIPGIIKGSTNIIGDYDPEL